MKIVNIIGYEGLYAVTDEGDIYSLRKGIKLNPVLSVGGYLVVCLNKNGTKYSVPVHKAVFYSFNGYSQLTRTDSLVIDHIDGNKTNNHLNNLRKITTRENTSRAKTNRFGKGVHYYKNINKYGAEIIIESERFYLGTYPNPEEAMEAYQNALASYEKKGTKPAKRDRTIKYCKGCGQTKPIDEFYHIKGHGYQTLCKECQRAQSRTYREKRKSLKKSVTP